MKKARLASLLFILVCAYSDLLDKPVGNLKSCYAILENGDRHHAPTFDDTFPTKYIA
jgi:hypothetical protein